MDTFIITASFTRPDGTQQRWESAVEAASYRKALDLAWAGIQEEMTAHGLDGAGGISLSAAGPDMPPEALAGGQYFYLSPAHNKRIIETAGVALGRPCPACGFGGFSISSGLCGLPTFRNVDMEEQTGVHSCRLVWCGRCGLASLFSVLANPALVEDEDDVKP